MPADNGSLDLTKFITHSQIGGIEQYTFGDGEARGSRALVVSTGGGLRYRILVDRGLDIDQAFHNQHSLTFLSHKGVTKPTRALDRGLDWLKGFPVGLLTSCGPFNIGAPATDQGEELGLHGPHSNTAAHLESVIQPDPHAGRMEMSIVGRIRYGAFYGPCVELRRTIASTLGENTIRITDGFYNAGNTTVPHAWLLHINFGYPLIDRGAEFCYDATKVEGLSGHEPSLKHFAGKTFKKMPDPLKEHAGPESYVGYINPKADRVGLVRVGVANPKINLGVAINYDTRQFPRCANWQHWGTREYVAALEPATGSVEGRDKDRAAGLLGSIEPGQRKAYYYSIQVLTTREELTALRGLNGK
jgi:hypothetical protein